MTLTPADITRIAALCERVWAKVPEARPTLGSDHVLHYDGDFWCWIDESMPPDPPESGRYDPIVTYPESHAIALIESAYTRLLLEHQGEVLVERRNCTEYATIYKQWIGGCESYRSMIITAPTLVEALLMAVRAKGKKEPTRE